MKKTRTTQLRLAGSWIALLLVPVPSAHAAAAMSGSTANAAATSLTGTVTNAATGRTLEGARVTLQGTDREALTDQQGVYRFGNINPGSLALSVSYTGLDSAVVSVTIPPGTSHRHDVGLTSEIYKLSQFVVSGEREGNAQAITLQRQSLGVKSVLSVDAHGSVASNAAQLLVRLPGVEGVQTDGHIRFIRIRGMSQNLSTITMDGNRLADAGTAGSGREFAFQSTGSDSIERIEVIKSPTPDMDGDSIGGAVNFITKSGFDSSGERRLGGSFGVNWRPFDPRETRAHRNYTLSYSEVFRGKLGVSFNAAYRPGFALEDETAQEHQQLPANSPGPAYTHSVMVGDTRNEINLTVASLRLDYKFSDTTRFFVNTSLNKQVEHEDQLNSRWATTQAVATRDASGNLSGPNPIIPGYTDTFTAVRAVPASTVTIWTRQHFKDTKKVHLQLGGVHRFKKLDIDYDAYKSDAKANYAGSKELNLTARGIGFTVDKTDDPYFPHLTQTAGPDLAKLESYTENVYNLDRRVGWDRYLGSAFNAKKQFETVVPTYIKAGVRWRNQVRQLGNTNYRGVYVGPDGVMGFNPATGVNDDNLAQFGQANQPLPDTKLSRYPTLPHPAYSGRGNNSVDDALKNTPQYFQDSIVSNVSNELLSDQSFEEDIKGYYVMGEVDLGRLSIMAGVRVEDTTVEGEGALSGITPEERARRAAWTGPVTDAELRRRTVAEFSGRQRRKGETRDVFPGVHFKFEPMPMLVTRLSYATNVGRPAIGQLIPRTSVDFQNRTISSSNPSLKSQIADNFDATAEYYFEPAGVISAGVFLKEIKRFIYTTGGATVAAGQDNGFGGDYVGYALTTQANGGFAKVKGLELNYNQQFTFLPGFWSGFGGFANYTRMQVEGNYGTGTAIALAPTSEVPGFNPVTANLGVSYIKNRINVRLQYNFTGRYLVTFSENQSRRQYLNARSSVNIRSVFQFSKHFDFYFDAVNISNAPDRSQEYFGGRPRSKSLMSPQLFFGVNGRM